MAFANAFEFLDSADNCGCSLIAMLPKPLRLACDTAICASPCMQGALRVCSLSCMCMTYGKQTGWPVANYKRVRRSEIISRKDATRHHTGLGVSGKIQFIRGFECLSKQFKSTRYTAPTGARIQRHRSSRGHTSCKPEVRTLQINHPVGKMSNCFSESFGIVLS